MNYMFDLISIGTISVDLFFKGESLTVKDDRFQLALGGKYDTDLFYESIGGGGANVAIGAHKHGLQTAVIGKIGNNIFKKAILEKLENESIYHRYCQFQNDYYNVSSIILHRTGERTVLHHQTPHVHTFDHEKDFFVLKKSKAAYIGNIPDSRLIVKEKLIHFLRENHIPIFINLGKHDCALPRHHIADLLRYIDVLIVNGHEFAEMVKAPFEDIDFSEPVVEYYLPQIKDKLVLVTNGARGSYAYIHDIVYHQKAITPSKIVDTTGAGDAYCAGFISTYIKTNNIRHSMEAGSKYAAKILGKIGAN